MAALESAGGPLSAIARPRGGIVRPAISIALFFTGLHVAGDLAGQAAAQAASTTASHLATEAAIAGGITGGGEALVNSTSEGVRQAAGRLFGRLQFRYAQQRAGWLAEWLERELLGDLLADLRRGEEVPQGAAFQELETIAASPPAVTAALSECPSHMRCHSECVVVILSLVVILIAAKNLREIRESFALLRIDRPPEVPAALRPTIAMVGAFPKSRNGTETATSGAPFHGNGASGRGVRTSRPACCH